jgi:hypothetical protein
MADLVPRNGSSAVVGLLFPGSPAAIIGTVRAVIVDSVNGRSGGAIPHVGKEDGEVIPFLAHGDASASVGGKGPIGRIPATLPDSTPSVVQRMPSAPVRREALDRGLRPEATAGCDLSAPKVAGINILEAPTVALASPAIVVGANGRNLFHRNQAPEALAGYVNLPARHAGNITHNWSEY